MTFLGVLHAGAALVRLGARLAGFAEPSPADMGRVPRLASGASAGGGAVRTGPSYVPADANALGVSALDRAAVTRIRRLQPRGHERVMQLAREYEVTEPVHAMGVRDWTAIPTSGVAPEARR